MEVLSMIVHKEYTQIAHMMIFTEIDGTHWLQIKSNRELLSLGLLNYQ